jgi:hypothetical protein
MLVCCGRRPEDPTTPRRSSARGHPTVALTWRCYVTPRAGRGPGLGWSPLRFHRSCAAAVPRLLQAAGQADAMAGVVYRQALVQVHRHCNGSTRGRVVSALELWVTRISLSTDCQVKDTAAGHASNGLQHPTRPAASGQYTRIARQAAARRLLRHPRMAGPVAAGRLLPCPCSNDRWHQHSVAAGWLPTPHCTASRKGPLHLTAYCCLTAALAGLALEHETKA